MSSAHLLQLIPHSWYAMEVFGASGAPSNPHVSPIFLKAVKPRKTGRGLVKLEFFHANYPEGVQNKECVLRVLHRTVSTFTATKVDDENLLVLIFSLEKEWLKLHFPKLNCVGDVDSTLDDMFNTRD